MKKQAFYLILSAICITGFLITLGCAKKPETELSALSRYGSADVPPSLSDLMVRTKEKLILQGVDCRGISASDGLVYPTIPGVVYVRWETSPDRNLQYISMLSGDPEACRRIETITDAKDAAGEAMTPADIPDDIRVLRDPEDGIDPYAFLGIPRQK